MNFTTLHTPVLVKEVLRYLDVKPNENVIDCTVGEGGHAIEILKKNEPYGKLLGIDWDLAQVERSRTRFLEAKERVMVVHGNYADIDNIVKRERFNHVKGILLDLGFSLRHMKESGRGFSFLRDEPLDMRYDQKNPDYTTAKDIINKWPENRIETILREFGEERFSKRIAREIVAQRTVKNIESTFELVDVVRKAVPSKFHKGNIHVATRVFQAIRIAVNQELENLSEFLPKAINLLESKGRLVVISFHSLEDRIVKNFFKDVSMIGKAEIITKKPIVAHREEVVNNPGSRSAKLRAIIKN